MAFGIFLFWVSWFSIGSGDWEARIRATPNAAKLSLPLRFGVPCPKAALQPGTLLEMVGAGGRAESFLSRPIAYWPDGSVKWLMVEMEASRLPLTLRRSRDSFQKMIPPQLKLTRDSESLWMDQAGLRVGLSKAGANLLTVQKQKTLQASLRWVESGEECRFESGEHALSVLEESPARLALQSFVSDEKKQARSNVSVELAGRSPWVRAAARFENCRGEEREVKDLELVIEGLGPVSKTWKWTEDGFEQKREALARKGRIQDAAVGDADLVICLENSNGEGCCFWIEDFHRHGPKQFSWESDGRTRLFLLSRLQQIPAYSGVSLPFHLFFHGKGWGEKEHLELLRAWKETLYPPLEFRGYLDSGCFAFGRPLSKGPASVVIREGWARLRSELEQNTGLRDFGDYHLSANRWANLEYDTAASLFNLYLATQDRSFFDWGRRAVRHWKEIDQLSVMPQLSLQNLPAIHSLDHTKSQQAELGHVWVEGLLLDYALTGDLSSRDAAIHFGDSLLQFERENQGRLNLERMFAWPILAWAQLESFFPGRGYREAMEDWVSELSVFYSPHLGFLTFPARLEEETGLVELNSWLSGGLLFEALVEYEKAGGKIAVRSWIESIGKTLLEKAWDSRKSRFAHHLVFQNDGKFLAAEDSLRTVWELYLFAGLSRAARIWNKPDWSRFVAQQLHRKLNELRWPKKWVGNDFSLLMRSLPELIESSER